MKRTYISPQMEVLEMELETVMMTQSTFTGVKEGETSDNFDSNRHRGSWGNLWD